MPRLRRFTADVGGAAPTGSRRATPASFGGQQAAALGQFAQAGMDLSNQLVRIQERRDKLAAQRDAAVVRERAVRRLDELRQTGEPVGEQFTDFLDSQLQELREERTTQEGLAWSERVAANIQSELGSAARRVDAQLAGDEAKEAQRQTMQSNGVFLQSSPDNLPDILMEQRDFVNELDIPENLKEPMLRELQASAAQNAAMGWIKVDPHEAKTMLEKGRFDAHITPDARIQLISRAETHIRAEREEERVQRAEQQRQRAIESSQLMVDAITDLNSTDPNERLTTAGIAALAEQTFEDGTPKLSPSEVDRLFNLRRTLSENGAVRSDPEVLRSLIMNLDSTSEQVIIEEAAAGSLAMSDFKWLMDHVRTGDTPLRKVRSTALQNLNSFVSGDGFISPMLQFSPAFGRMQSQALIQAQEREEQYREDGKNPIEYYRDGTFESDMRQLAAGMDVVSQQDQLQQKVDRLSKGRQPTEEAERRGFAVGSPLTGEDGVTYIYLGGPLDDYENSFIPLQELSGE